MVATNLQEEIIRLRQEIARLRGCDGNCSCAIWDSIHAVAMLMYEGYGETAKLKEKLKEYAEREAKIRAECDKGEAIIDEATRQMTNIIAERDAARKEVARLTALAAHAVDARDEAEMRFAEAEVALVRPRPDHELMATVTELTAQRAADTALLKRLEWQGYDPDDEPTVGYCPVCQQEEPDGHSDWCALAARLEEEAC